MARLGGWMLLLTGTGVAVEVILRKLFTISVGGANELSSYAFAVGASWAFGFTLLERGHIRIDAVYQYVPRRVRIFLDFLALFLLLVFVAFWTWRAGVMLAGTIDIGAQANTPLGTPLWIPQLFWLFGLIVFLAVGGYLFVRALGLLVRGRFDELPALIGTAGSESSDGTLPPHGLVDADDRTGGSP